MYEGSFKFLTRLEFWWRSDARKLDKKLASHTHGMGPARLAVTGDSAGGHLSASMATMIERVGDGAELVIVEDASHAFFDWKPDQRTKDTFAKYGVPYAADMMRFFDEVFYK